MPDDGYDALLNDDDRFCPSAFPKADGTSLTAFTPTLAEARGPYLPMSRWGHNARATDTIQQMALMARAMMGKRLLYQELIAEA